MEFLSSEAVNQCLAENEIWRVMGMLQNGSIQLSIVIEPIVSYTPRHGDALIC